LVLEHGHLEYRIIAEAAEDALLNPSLESRLSWFYYLFAPLAMLLATALFVLLIFGGLKSIDRSLTRVVVPGKTRVQPAQPGWYTIFYEYRSEIGGRVFDTSEQAPPMHCDLTQSGTGTKVALQRPAATTNYKMTRFAGYSVLGFQSDAAGEYDFFCEFQPGHSGDQVVLAMGTGVTRQIFKMVFVGLAVLLAGICAMVVISGLVYRSRNPRKWKKISRSPGAWPASS
jgi:hypothetical protein